MKIEKYLVLNKYLLSLFGKNEPKELFNELKNKSEGVDREGRSYFVNTLLGLESLKLEKDNLLQYDENIQNYVKKINYKREPVSLKYFQYLALLFTEIVLDNLKNNKEEFLNKLNEFLNNYNKENKLKLDEFTEQDLKKLAFWMATGSGKTLIMHINYYQFLNYNLFSPDNIILITPNLGLSKQHFEELQKSGIPCRLYSENPNTFFKSRNEILVIEMTKFVEEKKGGGVTLPVETFEGKNLIFVDEGHKGKKSEEQKWARLRDRLSENGFVFEYSATFGQILSEREPEILKEYAKSIIFDYSYKYFYLDGYGKDFLVLNVRRIPSTNSQEFQKVMFVANLLSFYEQLLFYEENKNLAKEYNIEKPLWIFVGTTVTGKKEESDVIQIVEFIKEVIQDEEWVKEWGNKILKGETNFKDENNRDIFENKFNYLKKRNNNIDWEDLHRRVFGGKGSFKLYELKNAEGEIGLKVSENEYFGVINIGDISGFKKQLEKKGILVEQDVLSYSLFDNIKKEDSKVNILIGSKKFIEGWDTWRVSSMGLLNIGTGEGPQIIQLFGRGVRIKGKKMSLKRSGENSEIRILETLNIYGIKADYLDKFLDAISKEEVELETIKIPIELQHEDKWENLYILSKPKKEFEEEEILKLEIDDEIYYEVDVRPKISIWEPGNRKETKRVERLPEVEELKFGKNGMDIDLLDWERIWQEIIEFKLQRNYWNLVFKKESLKDLLLDGNYTILSYSEIFKIKDRYKDNIKLLEDIALLVIKKYLDLFYSKKAKKFETENLTYGNVKQIKLPFVSENKEYYYEVTLDKKKKELIDEIRKLANNLKELLKEDNETLPRVYFDRSLYVPILLQSKEIDKISPPGLVESEEKFVKGLREYLKNNRDKISEEIYLLRNYPFSGVGFQLHWSKFYPDFIMWIKQEKKQIIVFVDPKGLEHTKGLNDEKIKFKDDIKQIEEKLGDNNIKLESFILSQTSYNDLITGSDPYPSKEEFMENHVLFLEDEDWPEKLFEKILKSDK